MIFYFSFNIIVTKFSRKVFSNHLICFFNFSCPSSFLMNNYKFVFFGLFIAFAIFEFKSIWKISNKALNFTSLFWFIKLLLNSFKYISKKLLLKFLFFVSLEIINCSLSLFSLLSNIKKIIKKKYIFLWKILIVRYH